MPRTQLEKVWLGAGVAAAIVLAAIGYFFLIGPQRTSTSDVESQIGSAQMQNDTLQARITALDAQNRRLSSYRAALKQAELALPSTSELPQFLRSLQTLGNATLVDVDGLTVGDPVQVTADGSAATDATAAPVADTATTAPPAGDASAPGTTSGTTGPQLFALPITATVHGPTKRLSEFLGQLQSVQPRAVLVTSVTLGTADAATNTGGGSSTSTSLTVVLDAFVAPNSSAETSQLNQAATN